jgi:ankyrin repeat protein
MRANGALRKAAEAGDIGAMRAAAADGASDWQGALFAATRKDQALAAAYCLDNGAQAYVSEDEGGYHPIHEAVFANALQVARLLLERGADPNVEEGDTETIFPLPEAARLKNPAMVRLLIEYGATLEGFASMWNATKDPFPWKTAEDKEIAEILLESFPQDAPALYENALGDAAEAGDLEGVRYLLERGVDPNGRGEPLAKALQTERAPDFAMLEALLDAGAALDTQPVVRGIKKAIRYNRVEVVEFLIERGALDTRPVSWADSFARLPRQGG